MKQQTVTNILLRRHTQSNKNMGVLWLGLCLKFEGFCRVIFFLLSLVVFLTTFISQRHIFVLSFKEHLALFTMLHHTNLSHISESKQMFHLIFDQTK